MNDNIEPIQKIPEIFDLNKGQGVPDIVVIGLQETIPFSHLHVM